MDKLIHIIAQIAKIPSDTISAATSLRALGLNNSIVLWRLHHALERAYDQKLSALSQELTIGQIVEQIEAETSVGKPPSDPSSAAVVASMMTTQSSVATAVGIGVDLEEVTSLPETQDYRNDAFYQGVFSPRELSHAILQANPRETLCGFFCAKEALKKTHPALVNLRLDEIFVSNAKGKPHIHVCSQEIERLFQFQVSISHTPSYATAVVLAFLR